MVAALLREPEPEPEPETGAAIGTWPARLSGAPPDAATLRRCARAFRSAAPFDPAELYGGQAFMRAHLPGYAFDERSYWFETAADQEVA